MAVDVRDQILAFIEQHLFDSLSVAGVAATTGLSPFHVSRLFTAVQGESVMAYVRRRRLEAAARRLLDEPQARLIDLSFDCGFESQEAFTRAFKRAFGVSPGRFRRGAAANLHMQGDSIMSQSSDTPLVLTMDEGLVHRGLFRVAGLAGQFDADTRPQIPGLWGRLVPRLPLPGQVGGEAYGLCWSTSPEEPFTYMAAAEIPSDAPAPDGLEALTVPAQTYLVFHQTIDGGPLQPQMLAAMREIWGRRLPASGRKPSGGPDFEFYPADFDQSRPGSRLAYWVPVEA